MTTLTIKEKEYLEQLGLLVLKMVSIQGGSAIVKMTDGKIITEFRFDRIQTNGQENGKLV